MVPLKREDEFAGYVTAARAAAMLGVRSPYISQLIDEGQLEGIALLSAEGAKKASVVLVSMNSITAYQAAHPERKRRGPQPGHGGRPRKDADD